MNNAVGVEIKNLTKTFPVFGNKAEEMYAVNNVSLSIEPGELVTLLGPSGCGKTTLLRMVAGFLVPTAGEIYIGDKEVSQIPPNKRNVGMMFQSYALFPHMTVYENVAYGLKLRKVPAAEIKQRVGIQTVGYDKLNQLRHTRFLENGEGVRKHMSKHAEILRPKFELVLNALESELAELGCCSWEKPRGGYFVSFEGHPGTAKRTVALAKEAGVIMTGAGATWPYKNDPKDTNIRIAPTLPPLDELAIAMEVFACCVKLATVEARLA